MLKLRAFKLVCGVLFGVCGGVAAGPSSAAIITSTYTGTVQYAPPISGFSGEVGVDYFGIFSDPGSNLIGSSFSAVYIIDESAPDAATAFILNDYSLISTSTMSAVIEINGNAFSFPSPSGGRVSFTNSSLFDGWGSINSAYSQPGVYAYGLISSMRSATDPIVPSYLYDTPFSFETQNMDYSKNSYFYIFNIPMQHYVEYIPILSSSVIVAVEGTPIPPDPAQPPWPGIPEPSTWTMMLLGFGALGAAMRSRRKTLSSPSGHWTRAGRRTLPLSPAPAQPIAEASGS